MRMIVAGSLSIHDYDLVRIMVEAALVNWAAVPSVILCGDADGVDQLGARWANEHGIPVEYHPSQWGTYGRSAGPRRNREMAQTADALVLVWDGQSSDSKNMLHEAKCMHLPVYECQVHQNRLVKES